MHRHRFTAAALAAVLLLGASACGSSSDEDTSASKATTTAAAPAPDDPDAGETTLPESDEETTAEGDVGAVSLVDGPADAVATVTFGADDAWDPAEIEIGVDEVITFQAAADAGTHAVTFNGADTYTISGGLTESFTISAPGTYTATEYLTGAEMTITVTG